MGSRIPSEKDTRIETKTGTGARPMLLTDIEEAFGIKTDEDRQKLYGGNSKVGSNQLQYLIYYPTLNKDNARETEATNMYADSKGDIGVSKSPKKLTDIKNEYYYVRRLTELHTKTYNIVTEKDAQKEIIESYESNFGSRSFDVIGGAVYFGRGSVRPNAFHSQSHKFGDGLFNAFNSYEYPSKIRPVVYLSSINNYYKAVSYTHLTLPTTARRCRSRWSPYH